MSWEKKIETVKNLRSFTRKVFRTFREIQYENNHIVRTKAPVIPQEIAERLDTPLETINNVLKTLTDKKLIKLLPSKRDPDIIFIVFDGDETERAYVDSWMEIGKGQ